jgi:hypothetical protein
MPGTSKEIQGVIQWDGKGNYTPNADVTLAGKTGSGSVTGTYTVDSNGRFSCQYIRVRCRSAARPSSTASSASGGDLKNLAQPQAFAAWLRPFHRKDWVVYLKHPFGGNIWAATPIAYPFQPSSRLLHRWPSHFSMAGFPSPK